MLKKNKNKVTKDELFKIQDSEPQFTIRNLFKDMAVSLRACVRACPEASSPWLVFFHACIPYLLALLFACSTFLACLQVSARNGTEVKADVKLDDIQDSERFQFEVKAGGLVHVMTDKLKYWVPRADSSIGAEADKQSANTAFRVDVRDRTM